MNDSTEKLDRLADLRSSLDLIALKKQELIDQVLTPEIKAALSDIEDEFAPQVEAASSAIAALEAEVKADVLAGGKTIKGQYLQAVFAKGRVSWDTSKLDGLMIVIPQLKEARKEGAPSVSLRKV